MWTGSSLTDDGPVREDRRSGQDRRSNFRRAIDALALTVLLPVGPISLACQRGAHPMCPWFCPACGADCACPCHTT
jgi:hypothetical protein